MYENSGRIISVREVTGCWYKLDRLLEWNSVHGKTSHGLEAIAMFHEGRLDELEKYCVNDVESTACLALMPTLRAESRVLPNHVFGIASTTPHRGYDSDLVVAQPSRR